MIVDKLIIDYQLSTINKIIMKSVLITFDQAYYERIIATLDRLNCRGFTYWEQVRGRGSKTGEPHYEVMHGLPCVLPSLRW